MYDRNSIKELKIVVIISNLGEGKYLTKDVFTQEEIKLKLRGMRRIHHRTDLGKGKVVYVAINEFTDCYSRYIHSWRDLTRLDSNSNLISNKSKLDEDFEKLNVANNLVKPEIIGL